MSHQPQPLRIPVPLVTRSRMLTYSIAELEYKLRRAIVINNSYLVERMEAGGTAPCLLFETATALAPFTARGRA